MLIGKGTQFNVGDTNGRRRDVLNSFETYLNVLIDLKNEYPDEEWKAYPASIKEYEFYKRAVEQSLETFKIHPKFDRISALIETDKEAFIKRDKQFLTKIGLFPYNENKNKLYKDYVTAIESKARHYTSSLNKLGFIDRKRNITQVGNEYINGITKKDEIEKTLPINDTNLTILRQALGLRVFTKEDENTYSYYNPVIYGFKLLMSNNYDKKNFKIDILTGNLQMNTIPECLQTKSLIKEDVFKKHITNQKSKESSQDDYYSFYKALYNFIKNPNLLYYNQLKSTYEACDENSINSAFLGEYSLKFKYKNKSYSFVEFREKHKDSPWFSSKNNFNEFFYEQYNESRKKRLIKDYGDTFFRLLSATGIINLDAPMPDLLYSSIFEKIFEKVDIDDMILGTCSEEEYNNYESQYRNSTTIAEIFGLSDDDINNILSGFKNENKTLLSVEKEELFNKHIKEKYSVEKVIELLGYFNDPKKHTKIQNYVNESADLPTIFEFLTALAWYYLSNESFSLYNSLNLTLDSNFDPIYHALGKMGDTVINYDEEIIMLEATLMNKYAQKKGELEPVHRHAVNLKADNEDTKTTTIFISTEIDRNTATTWRTIAHTPYESTKTKKQVSDVYIMPITIDELISLMRNKVNVKDVTDKVHKSFAEEKFNANWRTDILDKFI